MALPDYATQQFAAARQNLAQVFGMSEQEAIDQLAAIWRQRNSGAVAQIPKPQQTSSQSQSQTLFLATGHTPPAPEKKRMVPKIIQGRSLPTLGVPYIFEHAFHKLRNFEYVGLWYFTPKGCEMAAAHDLSFEAADTCLSWIGSSLTPIPTRSIAALKTAFVPDKDLTYDEMSIAKNILVTYMTKCDWPQNLINKFMHFFYFLDGHSIRHKPQGDQAIITYQAEARLEWHRDLATSQDNQVFDISIINNDRLESIAKEIRYSIQQKHILVSFSPNNEILTDDTFLSIQIRPPNIFLLPFDQLRSLAQNCLLGTIPPPTMTKSLPASSLPTLTGKQDLSSSIHAASAHQEATGSRDNSTVQSTTLSIPTARKRKRVRQSWMMGDGV